VGSGVGSGVGSPLSPSSVGFGGDGDGVEEGGGGRGAWLWWVVMCATWMGGSLQARIILRYVENVV